MPFVSITRLRLRSVRFLPPFLPHTLRSLAQVRRAPGLRGGALLADRRWAFWTITLWDDSAAMRAYMTGGDHRTAMPYLIAWCDEAAIVHWDQPDDALPSWPEADRRLRLEGRPSKLRFPSPRHANLAHDAPRTRLSGPIKPATRR